MKKVGILSMQRIKNYGSFLQAYALKELIKNLDCSVEFVDYHVEEPIIKESNKKSIIQKGLDALFCDAKLLHRFSYIIHKFKFNKYLKILNIEKKYNYNPNLDVLVIGSDEVFNIIQSNSNVGYSLELFGKNNNAKKVISYAASFGNTTLTKLRKYNKEEEIAKLLNDFSSISVRDENSKFIVENLINKKPEINLDPVLMYDFTKNGLIPNITPKEKYIILYAYNGRITKKEAKIIKDICKKLEFKIYAIGGAQPFADKMVNGTPFEILAYFKNAEFIITDTFHGSIFSIINKKRFYTLVRKSNGESYGNEEKLTFLLKSLGLTNRIINSPEDIKDMDNDDINYDKVFNIVEKERKKTIDYLKNNIK